MRTSLRTRAAWIGIGLSLVALGGATGEAHASAPTCSLEPHPANDFGLPESLVGPTVTLRRCDSGGVAVETLHVGLRLGPLAEIPLAGPYLGPGACLVAARAQEVWPGFAPDLQVSLCHDADGVWRPRVTGQLPVLGTHFDLVDAVVEQLAGRDGAVRLRLPTLVLGPFTLADATITTEVDGSRFRPSGLSGSLRWNGEAGGARLDVSGAFSPDAVEVGVTFAQPPPGFPFPGVSLPPLQARLRLAEREWRLFVRAGGPAQLGPLGTLSLGDSELEVRFRDGQWAMRGCLETQPAPLDLGVVRFDDVRVQACGLREGARVELAGRASFPALGLATVDVTGHMTFAAGAWTAELTVASRADIGPFTSVRLDGTLALAGTPGAATLDGCLRGDATLPALGGRPASLHASLGRCTAGATDLGIAVDGSVDLPGATAQVSGALVTGAAGAWSLHLDAEDVPLGPVLLEWATLDAAKDAPLELGGELVAGPLHLVAQGEIAPAGAFDVALGLLEPAVLPGGVTVTDAAGSRLRWTGSAWLLELEIGVEVDAGPFGTIHARGAVDAGFDAGTGQVTLSGCVSADAALAGLPVSSANASVCWDGAGVDVRVDGEIVVGGEIVGVSGALALGGADPSLELGLAGGAGETLVLAPGVVLDEVRLRVAPGSLGFELRGRLCVDALCLEVSGLWVPGGHSTLTATLAAGTPWRPIPSLPLTLAGGITGTLDVDGAAATLDVVAASTQSFELVPGLTLANVFARGRIAGGAWSVSLGGGTAIAFGASNFSLTVEGALDSSGAWTLAGSSDASFEPLAALVGPGRFTVQRPAFTIAVPAGGAPAVSLQADLAFCLMGGCGAATSAVVTTLRGGAVGGGTPGVWFVASVPGVELPGFGTLQAAVGASTVRVTGFDLAGTPGDASDDVTLEPGITLTAMAELPVRFGPQPMQARLTANVQGPTLISVSAAVVLNLDLVRPEHHLPGVARLTLQTLAVNAAIENGQPQIGVSASATFQPANQANPLTGTAALSMSATGDLGVDLALVGRWFEPFGLPKIAVQNPAFALSINVSSSLPIPSRIGMNGDLFWLKSGAWPSLAAWPLPVYGQDNPVPTNVAQLGGTLYFDAIPSPSGLCVGVCIPLPALVVRFDMHHLGTADLLRLASDMKTGARNLLLSVAPLEHRAALAALVPDGPFSMTLPSPLDFTINDLELYLSTHNLVAWDMPFAAGFRAVLDANVSGRNVVLRGALDQEGLLVEGRLAPLTLLGLTLSGDPMRKVAQLGGGTISVPSDARLSVAQGTIEGWLRAPTTGGTLASRLSGSAGYRVRLLAAQGGLSPVELTIGGGGALATLVTAPVVPANEWHHVAVSFAPGGARAFVDGAPVPFTAATVPPAPAATTAALTVGAGLTNVDEVRLWNVARSAEDIGRYASAPPFTAFADPRLVVRLAFDLDKPAGPTAHSSRFFGAGQPALHATYTAPAKPVADPREQALLARVRLALPGAGESGLALRAGASLDIPPLGGPRHVALSLDVGGGNATGRLFMPEAPLMTLTGFGSLVVGGRGENGNPGDFDDGLWGAFDVGAGALSATAGLYFQPTSGARQTLFDGALSWAGGRLLIDGDVAWNATLPGGAPMALSGTGRYDSVTGALSVNGRLAVFGQNLAAGAIKVKPTGISLRSIIDLDAVTGLPFGTTTLDLTLAYSPARLCGSGASSMTVPSTTTTVNGTVSVCLGASPSLSFNGSLTSLTIAGVTLQDVTVSYAQATGLHVLGKVVFLGNTVTLAGKLWPDGAFSWSSTATVTLGGWTISGAQVSFASYTAAHPRGSGPAAGLRVKGNLAIPGGTLAVDTAITPTGFTFTGSPALNIAGFALTDTSVRLSSASGLRIEGSVKVGSTWVHVEGEVDSASAFELCSAANIQTNSASGLPDLKGTFCLEKAAGQVTLTGTGKAQLWGLSFASSFSLSPGGGIAYLYVNVAVQEFSLLGVTASGRIKLKVEDNDLKYVRWYGALSIWGVIDFDSYINLSQFRLCPSDFGIDPTVVGLPAGCATLEI